MERWKGWTLMGGVESDHVIPRHFKIPKTQGDDSRIEMRGDA